MSGEMSVSIVLGIETSGRCPNVALLRDSDVVGQRRVPLEGSRRSSTLIEQLEAACRSASITPRQVQLVAVSIGPGSFTGLRIGVTFAKTLAYAVGCPVVAVNTLQAIAEGVPDDLCAGVESIHVVSDAQRGEVFSQPFARAPLDDDRQPVPTWMATAAREILAPATLAARLKAGDLVTGPGVERYHAELMSTGVALQLHPAEPDAVSVAQLGAGLCTAGITDAWSLLPDYGRLSSAEEKRGDQPRS